MRCNRPYYGSQNDSSVSAGFFFTNGTVLLNLGDGRFGPCFRCKP